MCLQVIESRDELRTVFGWGNSFFNGRIQIDAVTAKGGYRLIAPSAGSGETVNMNYRQSSRYSTFIDADNVWGNTQLNDAATIAADAHW